MRYFPSAAAAAEAGFRPCLRCRPECSPGTPATVGTQNTVSRALRLISETGLEEGGVEALAGHLGIGSRHLRRLFLRHLGATPSAVAHTRRLLFAKKLIDETRLPMTQIAFAASFGSVRRFNAAIRKTYQRTPTQIRQLAGRTAPESENHYRFQLHYRPPYQWNQMLQFLAWQATPGVEVVEGGYFRRSFSFPQNPGYFEATLDPGRHALLIRIQFGEPRSLFWIIERIRAMFDLNADWSTIAETLGRDPALTRQIAACPGLRVPGCWNGFEFAAKSILRWQMGAAKAGDLTGRLVRAFGEPFCPARGITHLFPAPAALANADLENVGLPRLSAEAIRSLARAVRDGEIDLDKAKDAGVVLHRLLQIPGMEKSSAQWVAVCCLREPDAFPSADRELAQAFAGESPREFELRSAAWRPWRAYAALYLWAFAAEIRAQQSAAVRTVTE